MKINFFEEFPKRGNLDKARLIKFPSLVYIAASSLKKFLSHAKYLKKINKKIIPAYWPTLKKQEGYWLSPFSSTLALKRVFNEITKHKEPLIVLLDLEFPTHAPKLLFLNFFKFFKNKKLIKKFLKNKPKHIKLVTAEYKRLLKNKLVPLNNIIIHGFLGFLGVHLKKNISERIFMCYTSMARNDYWEGVMRDNIQKQASVGLGTIAVGILGDEPILSPQNLQKDLELAQKSKTKSVTIFRLGGLNKEYLKVINNFKSN